MRHTQLVQLLHWFATRCSSLLSQLVTKSAGRCSAQRCCCLQAAIHSSQACKRLSHQSCTIIKHAYAVAVACGAARLNTICKAVLQGPGGSSPATCPWASSIVLHKAKSVIIFHILKDLN